MKKLFLFLMIIIGFVSLEAMQTRHAKKSDVHSRKKRKTSPTVFLSEE